MRSRVSFSVSPPDRLRLEAVVGDRNAPQKHVWRCRIVLLTSSAFPLTLAQSDRFRTRGGEEVRGAAPEAGHRERLGFVDNESLDRAKRFNALPAEKQERILLDRERREAPELPEHEPASLNRRAERVSAQAAEVRTRSVSVGLEAIKEEAAEYLLRQYTNADNEMICQVCKATLPFKLDDGTDYFEKVEFLPDLKQCWTGNASGT